MAKLIWNGTTLDDGTTACSMMGLDLNPDMSDSYTVLHSLLRQAFAREMCSMGGRAG